MGEWLEGKELAGKVLEEVKQEVALLKQRAGRAPGLAAIKVGHNPASEAYLRRKGRISKKVGIEYTLWESSIEQLPSLIEKLNSDDAVDGIILQLPLPDNQPALRYISMISPEKDVDGFTPENQGRLLLGEDGLFPATPLGIMEMLRSRGVELEGKRAVVVGRSFIVGKPVALMLLQKNATVSIAHSRTRDLPELTRQADILVVAVGRPFFIRKDMVREGAVVIDVGINWIDDREFLRREVGDWRKEELEKKGYLLVGDVHPEVLEVASLLTPVPGGVGQMTVAMLMKNTVKAFRRRIGQQTSNSPV